MGRLGAVMGASWASLERRKLGKARTPKTLKNKTININDFGIFGPSSVTSWRPLGASWKLLGLFGRSLGRLGACVRRFGALLDPPRDPRSHQGAPRGAPKNPRGAPRSPQEPLEAAGKLGSRPLRNLQPLYLRAAGLHESWGTPLRAESTVADYRWHNCEAHHGPAYDSWTCSCSGGPPGDGIPQDFTGRSVDLQGWASQQGGCCLGHGETYDSWYLTDCR